MQNSLEQYPSRSAHVPPPTLPAARARNAVDAWQRLQEETGALHE